MWLALAAMTLARRALSRSLAQEGPPSMLESEGRMRAPERRDVLAGTKWLLTIGQQLRAEYPAVEEPVPERLAALLEQVEKPPQPGPATNVLPTRPENVTRRLRGAGVSPR